jgi:hypothetical protein
MNRRYKKRGNRRSTYTHRHTPPFLPAPPKYTPLSDCVLRHTHMQREKGDRDRERKYGTEETLQRIALQGTCVTVQPELQRGYWPRIHTRPCVPGNSQSRLSRHSV